MILYNVLILRGDYSTISDIREGVQLLSEGKKNSKLYNESINKHVKNIKLSAPEEKDGDYNLRITFSFRGRNIEAFINLFKQYNAEIIHMCHNGKYNVWIVNERKYIAPYRLIPVFAINAILLDYMEYKEAAIILDTYETLKYDKTANRVVMNDKKMTDDELENIIYDKTVKGKPFVDILEQFINNFYDKCINNYQELNSVNSEEPDNDKRTSPTALFIVTLGIFAIIVILLWVMGYI